MAGKVKFSVSTPSADRIHHVSEDDVRVVLGRLPAEVCGRLRAVHLNDRSRGARIFGYVQRGRREIALCALRPRMSLTRLMVRGQSPEEFGACRGIKWPALAMRRFMLYDVFLHELGHLQPVAEHERSERLRFARERIAQEFANEWRGILWSTLILQPPKNCYSYR